ncbi:MAG: hypothetical protein EXS08_15380 [Planctomycetes bacterium]|nr:hypothetical protein [Planctomycetota bacterium]
MNTFRMQLWREWREHRVALLMLLTVLPLLGWLAAWVPPRAVLADPLVQSGAALTFVVVLLVATGGELLGIDRRGPGLRWLERLPSGLNSAFLAKLLFLALTTTVVAVYGLGVERSLALLRGVEPKTIPWEPFSFVAGVTLVAWTFACSAWALRGGLSLLAAALVLAVIGFPVWRVIDAGYTPTTAELATLLALLLPSALLGAWLAFVRGARRGGGTLGSALFGLAPATAVLALGAGWSEMRLAEHEAFDPYAPGFVSSTVMVTGDGGAVFLLGRNQVRGWKLSTMPEYALRVDLELGSFETLGRFVKQFRRYREDEHGLFDLDELVLVVEGREQPLVFDAEHGKPRAWDAKKKDLGDWGWKGLGLSVYDPVRHQSVIRDPFRGRDFLAQRLGEVTYDGQLLVRPNRWLYAPSVASWYWFDPETNERTPTGWPEHSRPLALFADGRILLKNGERGLEVIEPERGLVRELDTPDVQLEHIGERMPSSVRQGPGDDGDPIVLLTSDHAWLVLDADATTVRRLPVPGDLQLLRFLGPDAALVKEWNHHRFSRLDLVSGALTPLFSFTQEAKP